MASDYQIESQTAFPSPAVFAHGFAITQRVRPDTSQRECPMLRAEDPLLQELEAHKTLSGRNLSSLWFRFSSELLLQSHENFAAYMELNRSTIETLQAAAQSAHDAALEMSHTMLRLLGTQADSSAKGPQSFQIQETYKTALGGMRDFGEAALAAQSRALQAWREHGLKALDLTTGARGTEREP